MASINLGDTDHIAKNLAKQKYGGNVSAYIQSLIKKDYERVTKNKEQKQQNTKLLIFQLLFYSILTITIVVIGLTVLFTTLMIILPVFLLLSGIVLVLYAVATYKFKHGLNEEVII